jgi:hypothetical protein
MLAVNNTNTEGVLANGNRMNGADYYGDRDAYAKLMDSAEMKNIMNEYKDVGRREQQFGDLILHVIEQIEKECDEPPSERDHWPEFSLLDMKKFLKGDVNVPAVSENSPVFVLESVNGKVGQTLHNFNIYEICQLAACTKTELNNIIRQASGVLAADLETALQDAKCIMNILSEKEQAKVKEAPTVWNPWGINNLAQVSNLLHIKENGQKFASFMGAINPKNITNSIKGAFVGQNYEGENIDEFEEL